MLAFNFYFALSLALIGAEATVLHKFVDVKGNGAVREVRIMYDLYHNGDQSDASRPDTTSHHHSQIMSSSPDLGDKPSSVSSYNNRRAYEMNIPIFPWTQHSHSQQSAHAPPLSGPHNQLQPSQVQVSTSIAASHGYHPQYYLEQGMTKPAMSPASRIKYASVQPHYLVRGKALFVEVDFVPKYIPQLTYHVAVSVTLPAHIRGRPWILGYHQEVFPIPSCRLCTNRDQSFTLPVTLFLPDDGWCPEGRVPSIWKIEALPREPNNRPSDQTDMILAYGYDDLRQLLISNDANSTAHCRGISEAIVA